jgi:hypothetical protein
MNIKMNKRKRFAAAIIAACIASGTHITAQPGKSRVADRPVEIVMGHKELGKAPTIPVTINGRTYPFMFDSGGGITLISPDVAADIGCTPVGQLSAYNAGGDRIDMKRCDAVEMNVGGYAGRADTGVLEIMPFFGPNTPVIGGYVTLQTFTDKAITIDLAGDRIWVETPRSFAARIKGMKELESRLTISAAGAVIDAVVAANSPKGKLWFLFDSGNYGTLQIAPHAQTMLGIDFDAPNGAKMTKPVKLDFPGLGGVEMPGREREMIYDGMLNFDTIAKYVFTIDLKNGRMWAKPRLPVPASK